MTTLIAASIPIVGALFLSTSLLIFSYVGVKRISPVTEDLSQK